MEFESCLTTTEGPEILARVSLSSPLFSEFEIEQNGHGFLSLNTLENIPSCWLLSVAEPESDKTLEKFRLGCEILWPYQNMKSEKWIEIQSETTLANFNFTCNLFFHAKMISDLFSSSSCQTLGIRVQQDYFRL